MFELMVPRVGFEPTRLPTTGPKPVVTANSTIRARMNAQWKDWYLVLPNDQSVTGHIYWFLQTTTELVYTQTSIVLAIYYRVAGTSSYLRLLLKLVFFKTSISCRNRVTRIAILIENKAYPMNIRTTLTHRPPVVTGHIAQSPTADDTLTDHHNASS